MEVKNMEYVYAALLLHKAGKEINEENVNQVLGAAGIKPDSVRVKALIVSVAEVNIDEVIKASPALMASAPVPAAAAQPTAPQAKPAEDKKKKEEEEKKKEEAAIEGLGALFG